MKDVQFICLDCESEVRVIEIYSDLEISHCPFCGVAIELSDEE